MMSMHAEIIDFARRTTIDATKRYFSPLADIYVSVKSLARQHAETDQGNAILRKKVLDIFDRLSEELELRKQTERSLRVLIEDLQNRYAQQSRKIDQLINDIQKSELRVAAANEASNVKSEFLANFSHELRTPLNAILGFSEIMGSELYGPLGDDKYKEYIKNIDQSGRHLLTLIDDILDMSKIEAGRLTLAPRRVELEELLEESLRLVMKRVTDRSITLTSSVKHVPPVWADPRAVKQVLLNIISNSIKYTESGGEISVTAEIDLDSVSVIIADSGRGIDRATLAKLGTPFAVDQHFSSSASGGAGLGLALSKSLMELQGGLLAIASQETKGTVACFTLPRRAGASVSLPKFIRNKAVVLTAQVKPASPNWKEEAAQ